MCIKIEREDGVPDGRGHESDLRRRSRVTTDIYIND